jgi:hypothetical protein
MIAHHVVEDFWSQVNVGKEAECWEWIGEDWYKGLKGMYGVARSVVSGKKTTAHRVAWELTNGPIPKGLFALHKCDNKPCCNPNHLFIGTQSDNIQDASNKGRMVGFTGKHHSEESKHRMGELHKGFCHTEESKRKIGESHKREKLSVETRNKMSASQYGNKKALGYSHSEEHNRKIGLANSRRIILPETREKHRKNALGNKHRLGKEISLSSRLRMVAGQRRRYAYVHANDAIVRVAVPIPERRTPIISN